jgi:hypothetical protein
MTSEETRRKLTLLLVTPVNRKCLEQKHLQTLVESSGYCNQEAILLNGFSFPAAPSTD